jgi:hypothetical protein
MKTILHVETWPSSPDRVDEFNRWYDEVHLPQVLALDGFVSARRFAPTDDGPYVIVYELEGDGQAAVQGVIAAGASGKLEMSDVLQLDPRPKMRLMRVVSE